MFTGIIEEVGLVRSVQKGAASSQLAVAGAVVMEDIHLGDSIAVNGVCLTVTSFQRDYFTCDVMAETLRRSNLGLLAPGSSVNLERAMAADGRFGGHIVSGHIDTAGTVSAMKREDNAVWVTVSIPKEFGRYIVSKGSIAIDGISLTVASVTEENFSVSIIPHTAKETILLGKVAGDTVNIECDVIGKYVEKLLLPIQNKDCAAGGGGKSQSRINMEFLTAHGF